MTLVEDPGQSPKLCLDEMLNLAAARPLAEALASIRGVDVRISAANVRHLGAQCGQILIAGMKAWQDDGHSFEIVELTPEFQECAELLGIEAHFRSEELTQ
jgi:chemotaxis protein CheX